MVLCQVWFVMFQESSMFFTMWYYLPFKKGLALHKIKLECSLSNFNLCQVWLKYWPRISEEKDVWICQCIFAISHLTPIGKWHWLLWSAFCLRMLCQVWLKMTQCFWRRRLKSKKCKTDKQSEELTWAFSLGELKIKNICKCLCCSLYVQIWHTVQGY